MIQRKKLKLIVCLFTVLEIHQLEIGLGDKKFSLHSLESVNIGIDGRFVNISVFKDSKIIHARTKSDPKFL